METDAVVVRLKKLSQQKKASTLERAPKRRTPSSSETPSVLSFEQLTIASDKVERRLPGGRLAENSHDRRSHLCEEVV